MSTSVNALSRSVGRSRNALATSTNTPTQPVPSCPVFKSSSYSDTLYSSPHLIGAAAQPALIPAGPVTTVAVAAAPAAAPPRARVGQAALGLGRPPCKVKPTAVSGFSDLRDASYFINDHAAPGEHVDVTAHRRFLAGHRAPSDSNKPAQLTAPTTAPAVTPRAPAPEPIKYQPWEFQHKPRTRIPTGASFYAFAIDNSPADLAHAATGCQMGWHGATYHHCWTEDSISRRHVVHMADREAEQVFAGAGELEFGLKEIPTSRHLVEREEEVEEKVAVAVVISKAGSKEKGRRFGNLNLAKSFRRG